MALKHDPDAKFEIVAVDVTFSGTLIHSPEWIASLRDLASTLCARVEAELETERRAVVEKVGKLAREDLERRFREDQGDIPEKRRIDRPRVR